MIEHAEINITNNRLLNFLSAADRSLLAPHMRRVQMVPRQVLEKPEAPIEHIYFPEDGVLSVVSTSASMGAMEIAVIGKEGMTGVMVVLGNDRGPMETFTQVAGSAMAISSSKLRDIMQASPGMRDLFLSYVQVFLIQTSQTALANAASLLPQRLARWLLMCSDRLTAKNIPITTEFLSVMLGVTREGIAVVIDELETHGLIKAERRLISILDREGLINLADGAYGVPEAAYERLFGKRQRQGDAV
jgi:CRP-like cAMP-binding protein